MADKFAGGIKAGSVDVSLAVLLRKTADNTEHTGAAHSDVTASYLRQGGSRTAITMANLSAIDAAHDDGGWEQADATNMPGLYRFDPPDAAFATGADWVVISIKVASCYVFYERYALETKGAAELSARIPTALVSGRIDASVGAVATDAIGAAGVSAAAGNKIADHTLRRTLANVRASANGDAVAFRSPLGALSKLVNKVAVAGGTLSVYDETDQGTPIGEQTATESEDANPITGLDTV